MQPAGDFSKKIHHRGYGDHRAFLREVRVLCGESLLCSRLVGAAFLVCVCLAGCGGGGGGGTSLPPPTCPSGAVILNPTSIIVGATSQASAPSGFTGGTFSSDNANVAAVSGSTVTGVGAGSATIGGSEWVASNGATGCSLTGASLTVTLPVSISITSPNPIPTAVGSGGTLQFGATVTGTSNVAVNWKATPAAAGAINSGGLFTAATAVSADTMVTVTATAAADTTKSAMAQFEVTIASIITSIAPPVFRCDAECGMVTETMSGSGFQIGDTVNTVPNAWPQLVELVNPDEVYYVMGLDTFHSSPGSFTFTDCRGTTTTCSNPWNTAFTGNQNDLVIGPDGELYNLDRVAGYIWKFKADATPDGNINTGPLAEEVSIAFDATNDSVWENQYSSGLTDGYSAATGAPVASSANAGNLLSDSAVEDSVYCGTENTAGDIACLFTKTIYPTFAYASAGMEPYSIVMLTLNQGTQSPETDAFVYDREGLALYDYVITPPSGSATIPTIALKPFQAPLVNPLILAGLMPADTLTNTGKGGWYLARFETGPAAGTVALLSAFDNVVVFVNAGTMTEIKSVPLNLPAQPASGSAFRLAADETNGRAIVAIANVGASTSTTFLAVTPAGTVTPLAAVAQNVIAVGLGVSADGTKIYACMRNQCDALPNQ